MIGAIPKRSLFGLHRASRFVPLCVSCLLAVSAPLQAQSKAATSTIHLFVDQYCAGCHNADKKKGELDLEAISAEDISKHPDSWEKVVRRLRARQMPPAEKKRPD